MKITSYIIFCLVVLTSYNVYAQGSNRPDQPEQVRGKETGTITPQTDNSQVGNQTRETVPVSEGEVIEEGELLIAPNQQEVQSQVQNRTNENLSVGEKNRVETRERERIQQLEQIHKTIRELAKAIGDNDIQEGVSNLLSVLPANENASNAFISNEERSPAIKFLVGPNYRQLKNVKQTISSNSKIIDDLSSFLVEIENEQTRESITQQIRMLELYNYSLNDDLSEATKGFSLFGWLNRIIVKY